MLERERKSISSWETILSKANSSPQKYWTLEPKGSAIKVIDDWGRGAEEPGVMFATPYGVYVGRDDALLVQLTPNYSVTVTGTGIITRATAIIKDDRGLNQYLMVAEIS